MERSDGWPDGLAGPESAFDVGLTWDPSLGGFRVPWRRDLHVVIVWSDGLPLLGAVRAGLGDAGLEVIAETEVVWTRDLVPWNLHRFYGNVPRKSVTKADRVGWGPFRLLVVEDPEPVYRYLPTFSGDVRPVNARMHGTKAALRELEGLDTRLHSSNRAAEFLRDGVLLLGRERFLGVIAGEGLPPRLETDLAGARGWSSLAELSGVLELAAPYVLLRSFAAIAEGEVPEGSADLDVLAASRRDLVLAAAGRRHRRKRDWPHFITRVGDRELRLDVREIGDGHLDPRWQEHLLGTAVVGPMGFRIPAVDERFLSLAHHVIVHKAAVKATHRDELRRLAGEIGLGDALGPATASPAEADAALAAVLAGAMKARRHRVPVVREPGIVVQAARVRALLPGDLLEPGAVIDATSTAPRRRSVHIGGGRLRLGVRRATRILVVLVSAFRSPGLHRARPVWRLAEYESLSSGRVVHRVVVRALLRPSDAVVRAWDGWERTLTPLPRTPHVRLLEGLRDGRDEGAPYLFAKAQQFSCGESEVIAHRDRFVAEAAAWRSDEPTPAPLVKVDGLRAGRVRVVDGVHRLALALVLDDDRPREVLVVV